MFMKNKVRFPKNNVLHIASYFFLFALLTNIIYVPCYFYIQKINQQNAIENYQKQLDYGMYSLDASMNALSTLPSIISSASDYKVTYHKRSDFSDIRLTKLREIMKDSLLPFDCITQAGLTMDNSLLFTKKYIFYERDFLSYDYYFSVDMNNYFEKFTGAACAIPATYFTTADQGNYNAITIAYRWIDNLDLYFFAHYSLGDLFLLFADDELLNSGHIAIYSQDVLLAEQGTALSQDYVTLSAKNSVQPYISVVLQVPNSHIHQNLTSMYELIKLFVSIVIIAAVLWIVVFSFIMWRPFRSISNALHNTGYMLTTSPKKTFIDSLIYGINDLGHQAKDYKQLFEKQLELSRIHIFERALFQGLYNEDSYETFKRAFPEFPAKWKLVTLQYTSDDSVINTEMMQLIMEQSLQDRLSPFFVLSQNQDTLLALLASNSAEETMKKINEFCNQITDQYQLLIQATISKTYNHPKFLVNAFQELEYSDLSTTSQYQTVAVSMHHLQMIYYSLQSGDSKSAISTLKSCTANVFSEMDFFTAKHSYRMLNYVLISLKLENPALGNIPLPPFREDNNYQVLFDEDFPQCFIELATQIKQQHTLQKEKQEHDIFSFINENLGNQQLSITLVTDQFHISAPTLQKRMQAHCGKTFSAYVESARMEKAKQLLCETNLTVQSIAESLGFLNINSFYKAYKRYFGEPPLASRKRNC